MLKVWLSGLHYGNFLKATQFTYQCELMETGPKWELACLGNKMSFLVMASDMRI